MTAEESVQKLVFRFAPQASSLRNPESPRHELFEHFLINLLGKITFENFEPIT